MYLRLLFTLIHFTSATIIAIERNKSHISQSTYYHFKLKLSDKMYSEKYEIRPFT